MTEQPLTLGQRLRSIRHRARWTLKEMSERSAIPVSTLSKVERDTLSLNYPQLLRLMKNLGLRASDLFEPPAESEQVAGWRSIQRAGAVAYQAIGAHERGLACTDLRQKKMKPMLVHLCAAQTNKQAVRDCEHGDIYLFVLDGSIEVSTQLYEPVVLNTGDSIYMDAKIEHCYAPAAPSERASALIVCSD